MRDNVFLAAAAAILFVVGCTVEVRDNDEPKGGCLYHCEGKACCVKDVTEASCQQRGGSWSADLKECPD